MRVTATFEVLPKLAPHLYEKLREIPSGVTCTILGVENHVEQILPERIATIESEGGRGGDEQGAGVGAEPVDNGENGELAGIAGEGIGEPSGGDADEGTVGTVSSEEGRDVMQPFAERTIEAEALTGDSGAREQPAGDTVSVPKTRKRK